MQGFFLQFEMNGYVYPLELKWMDITQDQWVRDKSNGSKFMI